MRNSRIYRNAGWGIHVYNGDYPKQTPDNNVIRSNEVFDNGRAGDRGPGIILSSGSKNTAYNNLLWGNKGSIQIDYGASRAKAFNNKIYANLYGIYLGSGSKRASVRNSVLFQNAEGGIIDDGIDTTRGHNLTNDPGLRGRRGPGLPPPTVQPRHRHGCDDLPGPRDFDGISRPQCTGYDIGAHEFNGCP